MTKTLADLIKMNDFTGYRSDSAAWQLESDEIESAIYGSNGASCLPYDLVEEFAKQNSFELISVNTWICTDTAVGLQVMRLGGKPVGLVWQPARKSVKEIAFLNKDCLETFRAKWEEAKSEPETDCTLVGDNMLNMPIADPGAEPYEIDSDGYALPYLTAAGALKWIEAEGGLDKVTDHAALAHVEASLSRNIADRTSVLEGLRDMASGNDGLGAIKVSSLEELETYCSALQKFQADVQARIATLKQF